MIIFTTLKRKIFYGICLPVDIKQHGLLGTRENYYTIKLGFPANSSDNYRPVSLLSILSKILERHVHSVIADHLDKTCSLGDCQWGFRAGRLTVGALLATTSHWFSLLEEGK